MALAEQKQAKKAQEAQNVFAKNRKFTSNSNFIINRRSGNIINLLVGDQARQAANYRESVRQTLESFADSMIETYNLQNQNIMY